MVTREDIEGFLDRLSAEGGSAGHTEIEPGLWVVKLPGSLGLDVVVHYSPPVVILRVKVMNAPKNATATAKLNQRLLQLNATDLVHGAYGLERESYVLSEALELGQLDYAEFQSAYEGMTLALAAHLKELATFRDAG
jgi:hypothetical protein